MASKDIRIDRGTAAQSGAADLAVVGAVPTAFAIPTPVEANGLHIGAASSTAVHGEAIAPAPSHVTLIHDGGAVQHHAATSGSAVANGFATPILATAAPAAGGVHAPVPEAPAPHGSSGVAVYVPASHAVDPESLTIDAGTGSRSADVSPINPTSHGGLLSLSGSASDADPAALGTVRVSVAALQDAITALSDRLPTASEATGGSRWEADDILAGARDTLSSLDHRLADVAASAGSLAHDVSDRVVDSVDEVVDRVGDAAQEAIGNVAELGSDLTRDVSDRVSHVADTVAEATDAAIDLARTATDRLADSAGGAVGGVAHHVGDVVESIPTQFAGVDPPAGIHTLVGMVSAADVFKLPDNNDHHAPLAPALGALGAADLLADAHPSASLLGISDHHHDGLLGGLSDHDGLFGHG